MPTPDLDQETLDYVAIQRLQSRYADIVTRRAFGELERIFVPQIPVVIDRVDVEPLRLIGAKAVGDFIAGAIAHFDLFEFVILNTVVDIAGDHAKARMYMWELRHDRVGGRSDAYGLYRDDYQRVEGRWLFAARRYQTLARTLPADFAVFPLPVD